MIHLLAVSYPIKSEPLTQYNVVIKVHIMNNYEIVKVL